MSKRTERTRKSSPEGTPIKPKTASFIVAHVLIAGLVLGAASCASKKPETAVTDQATAENPTVTTANTDAVPAPEGTSPSTGETVAVAAPTDGSTAATSTPTDPAGQPAPGTETAAQTTDSTTPPADGTQTPEGMILADASSAQQPQAQPEASAPAAATMSTEAAPATEEPKKEIKKKKPARKTKKASKAVEQASTSTSEPQVAQAVPTGFQSSTSGPSGFQQTPAVKPAMPTIQNPQGQTTAVAARPYGQTASAPVSFQAAPTQPSQPVQPVQPVQAQPYQATAPVAKPVMPAQPPVQPKTGPAPASVTETPEEPPFYASKLFLAATAMLTVFGGYAFYQKKFKSEG